MHYQLYTIKKPHAVFYITTHLSSLKDTSIILSFSIMLKYKTNYISFLFLRYAILFSLSHVTSI